MAYDLPTAKDRLGITGTDEDAAVQASLNAALNLAERYCDRRFMYGPETERFIFRHGEGLQLRRFPVETVQSITAGGLVLGTDRYTLLGDVGQIVYRFAIAADDVTVTYTGGYAELPDDLELALWLAFDAVYAAGAETDDVGAAIESITIADVGTVRYARGSGSASETAVALEHGLLPPVAVGILQTYRVPRC